LNKNFGKTFPKLFRSFSNSNLEKIKKIHGAEKRNFKGKKKKSENEFRNFNSRTKIKTWRMKKRHGAEKRNFHVTHLTLLN
jgi:hypothetical protein